MEIGRNKPKKVLSEKDLRKKQLEIEEYVKISKNLYF
jgi:hypothetical protein